MRLAVERHHVMFALRGEFDIADQHEVVIARGLAEGAVEHLRRTLMIALIEFVEGFDHPARRIQEALAAGVFGDYAELVLRRLLGFSARWTRLVRAYGSGEKFGRIQLGGTALRNFRFRNFRVARLGWAYGFDQCVHVNS